MGGIPFPEEPWTDLRRLFTPPAVRNETLFASASSISVTPAHERAITATAATSAGREASELPAEQRQPEDFISLSQPEPECDGMISVDAMLALLKEPRAEDWLAEKMCVRAVQMRDWLDRGVREGTVNI